MKQQISSIICNACIRIVGTVEEIENTDKPGFFRNVPKPDPMPLKCPECRSPLQRVFGKLNNQ